MNARRLTCALLLAAPLLLTPASLHATAPFPLQASASTDAPGVPFSAERLNALLPPSVYFQGKSAPLQLRNAGGTALNGNQILWAALVDTSGYSTSVQERYQFYFVTEGPLTLGDVKLPAGAYGGGFIGDHFLIMDPGGHTVAQGPLHTDSDLKRPRPLKVVANSPSAVRLYLGRRWVLLQAAP